MTDSELVDLIADALVHDSVWHGYFPAGHQDVDLTRAAGRRAGRQLGRQVRTFSTAVGEDEVRVSVRDVSRPDPDDELAQRRFRAKLRCDINSVDY